MSDSGSFWDDVGNFIEAVAVEVGANALENAFKGDQSHDQSQTVAVQEPVGAVQILVGGWCRVAGDKVFHETQPSNISRFYSVQALADHRLEYGLKYLNSDIALFADGDGWVTDVQKLENRDGRYNDNKTRILTREGLSTETAYTETDSDMVGDMGGLIDATFRGDGTASIMMLTILPTAAFRTQAFPGGRPELSVEARNAAVYDWRDEAQDIEGESTWGPCHNPVVNLVHLERYRWGRDWTRCIAPVLADLTAEADYCDNAISLNAGGTEPRYEVAFYYRDSDTRDSVRTRIKSAMDGFITTDGLGHLIVRAGRYEAPTLTIPGDFVTAYTWTAGVDPDNQFDRYEIEFTNPKALYNKDQADALVLAEGERSDTLDFTMVTSWTQARRLAYREPPKRQPRYSGTFTVGDFGIAWFLPDADGKRCPRYILIDMPDEPTLHLVPLEVVDVEDDLFGAGFTFTLRTADTTIDAWDPATQEGNPPADPDLT